MSDALDLASTADLQTALFKRFDHLVFYGIKMRPSKEEPNLHIVSWKHQGDVYKCAGLATRLAHICNTAIDTVSEELSTDDL